MKSAISTGYQKGFATILDANVVTIITAFILFVLATAGVRGFRRRARSRNDRLAVHRGHRHLGDPRAALRLEAARPAVRARRQSRRATPLAVRLHRQVEEVLLRSPERSSLIGALAIAGLGLNLGIDFTGGTRITVGLEKPPSAKSRCAPSSARSTPATRRSSASAATSTLGENAFQISSDKIGPEDVPDRARPVRGPLRHRRADAKTTSASRSVSVGPTFGAGRRAAARSSRSSSRCWSSAPTSRCDSSRSSRCRC